MLKTARMSWWMICGFLFVGVLAWGVAPTWGESPGQDDLDRGVVLYQEGRYQEALTAFKKATQRDPGLMKAWENLGWTYDQLNRTEETIKTWEMLLKIYPENVVLLNSLGSMYMKTEAWTNAIAAYTQSLRLQPDQLNLHLRLGDAYRSLDLYEDAAEQYDQALKLDPRDVTTVRKRTAIYKSLHQIPQAILFLEKELSRHPHLSADLSVPLGSLYAQQGGRFYGQGDYAQAEVAYRAALRWDDSKGKYWVNLGWAKRKQGDVQTALEMWQKALSINPKRDSLYRHIGDVLLEQGKLPEAHLWYKRAWESGRREPMLPYRFAEAALQKKNLSEAFRWLSTLVASPQLEEKWLLRVANLAMAHDQAEMGINLLKNRPSTRGEEQGENKALSRLYVFQGEAAYKQSLFETAIAQYREALQYDPNNTPALRDLGWAYWRAGQFGPCEEIWKRYRLLHPDEPTPYNLLTQLYLFRKSYPEAVASATMSLHLSPDQPDQKLKRAKALFQNSQFAEAQEAMETLVKSYPNHLPIQTYWGELLMQYHDFKRGVEQLQRVIDLGADSPKLRAYWIRSLYGLRQYKRAIHEAKRAIKTYGAQEPFLKILAEDALVREDREEAIHWYKLLTERSPQQPSFWLELSSLQVEAGHSPDALETLRQAHQYHPDHFNILLSLLEAKRLNGNIEEAYQEYVALGAKYPDNRHVYLGMLESLIEQRHYSDALQLLAQNRSTFLKAYEVDLQRGRIHAYRGDLPNAESLFTQVSTRKGDQHYIPILIYHGISTYRSSGSLRLDLFESQVRTLKQEGYHFMTVRELGRMIKGDEPFPLKPILLTFDDARIDSFQWGDLILAKYNVKATMFVPSSYILHGHPFFAGWDMVRFYAQTGRWDMQAHGHLAHKLVPIDATGKRDIFLINRQWLEEEKRLEQESEYVERIENDYRESIRQLNENVPGLDVIGYAFPFSEAGQFTIGNVPHAAAWNKQLVNKHFRFSFVQDKNGYNVVERTSVPSHMMLRRFSVPSSWDGNKLVKHLAKMHPRTLAADMRGQAHAENGRHETARLIFNQLASEEPLLSGQIEYRLAMLSHQQMRFKDAQEHLTRALAASSEEAIKNIRFQTQIFWVNRPQFGTQFHLSQEPNNRAYQEKLIRIRDPGVHVPFNFSAEIGQIAFQEGSMPELAGEAMTLEGQWGDISRMSFDGKIRARRFSTGGNTENVWLRSRYRDDVQVIEFQGSYEDVETLQAHQMDLQSQNYETRYRLRLSSRWEGLSDVSYRAYEDGNKRTDISVRTHYTLPFWPEWRIGAIVSRSDSLFRATRYYTPEEVGSGLGVITYSHSWKRGGSLTSYGEVGLAEDAFDRTTTILRGSVTSAHFLTDRLQLRFEGDYSQSPNYYKRTFEVMLDYLF